ncbi:MAG: hypothetical protein ABIG44_18665 [Planctomycetota bacterium]
MSTEPPKDTNLQRRHWLWATVWDLSLLVWIVGSIGTFIGFFGCLMLIGDESMSRTDLFLAISIVGALSVATVIFFLIWLKARRKVNAISARLRQLREEKQSEPPSYNPPTAVREVSTQRVHFALQARRETQKAEASDNQQTTIYCGCLIVAGVAVYALWQLLGISGVWVVPAAYICFVAFPLGCMAYAFYVWHRNRHYRSILANVPDESFRLRCIGAPEELEKYGELVDVAFEPAIFNVSWTNLAVFRSNVRWFAIFTGVIAWIVISIVCCLAFGFSINVVLNAAMVASLIACVATALIWHTYIRITPGQLEIVQYSVFGRKSISSFAINLREVHMLVNLWRGYVHIDSPEPGGEPFRFSTALIPGSRRLAYMILLGALSTHKPGPLPLEETEDYPFEGDRE